MVSHDLRAHGLCFVALQSVIIARMPPVPGGGLRRRLTGIFYSIIHLPIRGQGITVKFRKSSAFCIRMYFKGFFNIARNRAFYHNLALSLKDN